MKMQVFYAAALLLLLTACGNKYGKLARRYNTATDTLVESKDLGNWVTVDGYFFNVEEPVPPRPVYKTIFDFPPSVQKELVSDYYKSNPKPADLIHNIAAPFKPEVAPTPDEAVAYEDHTSFRKRFVATIRNQSFYPADRIWKINIRLTKDDGATRFASTSAIATDFESVDVGKLGYTNKSTFSTKLDAGSGISTSNAEESGSSQDDESLDSSEDETTSKGDNSEKKSGGKTSKNSKKGADQSTKKGLELENKIGGSIGYINEFSMSEEVLLKQRYVKLSGSVKKNMLSLYQESTSGIDLSGNIVADVEIRNGDTDPTETTSQRTFIFSNFQTGGTTNEPKDIKAREVIVVYPLVKSDIYGQISFDVVVRRVKDKANTIIEADDVVEFLHGSAVNPEKDVLVLTKRDVLPNFWELANSAGNPVRIKTLTTPDQDLRFRSLEDAREFLGWLSLKAAEVETAKGVIGNGYEISMGTGGGSLTAANLKLLTVRIVR